MHVESHALVFPEIVLGMYRMITSSFCLLLWFFALMSPLLSAFHVQRCFSDHSEHRGMHSVLFECKKSVIQLNEVQEKLAEERPRGGAATRQASPGTVVMPDGARPEGIPIPKRRPPGHVPEDEGGSYTEGVGFAWSNE
jgi:hypothetical protein